MINNLDIKLPLLEKKRVTERGEILEELLSKVNEERKGTKYKPMTIRGLAVKLSHLSVPDLYYMKSICQDYKSRKGSFSKCLFGSIKVQPK